MWLLCALASHAAAAGERPSVLLLVAEDLSPRIGAFGDAVARTPHLDRLAAEGTRFPNAFTTSGVCAPSRAALVTGMHQIAIGAQHMRASSRPAGGYLAVPPPEVKAFPELLRRAGYFTLTSLKLDYQFSGALPDSGPFTIWDAEGFEPSWEERPEGTPFFALLNFGETHESGQLSPLGSWPHGATHLAMQLLRAWHYGLDDGEGPIAPAQVALPRYYPDTPVVRAALARHYNQIARMDAAVGAVLARLAREGLADSTIVVFTTDHGDALPRAKRELFDSGIRVPMIVRWPARWRPEGLAPGGVDERLVSFVDLAPTILEWAGAERPAWLHGRSLSRLGEDPQRYVFAARDRIDEVQDRQRAVRDERFKYVRSWHPELPGGHPLAFRDDLELMRELRAHHESGALDGEQRQWFEPPGAERLFDTWADPDELRDLSRSPAHAHDLARLRAALDAWLARVGDASEEPEDAMVARFAPGGERPVTAEPKIERASGRIAITCETPGASIGFRDGTGPWRLYVAPFDARPGTRITAKAVRYGFYESAPATLAVVD
jgi:arylsulfatase A-like enzyme